jgi:hypothetical protein
LYIDALTVFDKFLSKFLCEKLGHAPSHSNNPKLNSQQKAISRYCFLLAI